MKSWHWGEDLLPIATCICGVDACRCSIYLNFIVVLSWATNVRCEHAGGRWKYPRRQRKRLQSEPSATVFFPSLELLVEGFALRRHPIRKPHTSRGLWIIVAGTSMRLMLPYEKCTGASGVSELFGSLEGNASNIWNLQNIKTKSSSGHRQLSDLFKASWDLIFCCGFPKIGLMNRSAVPHSMHMLRGLKNRVFQPKANLYCLNNFSSVFFKRFDLSFQTVRPWNFQSPRNWKPAKRGFSRSGLAVHFLRSQATNRPQGKPTDKKATGQFKTKKNGTLWFWAQKKVGEFGKIVIKMPMFELSPAPSKVKPHQASHPSWEARSKTWRSSATCLGCHPRWVFVLQLKTCHFSFWTNQNVSWVVKIKKRRFARIPSRWAQHNRVEHSRDTSYPIRNGRLYEESQNITTAYSSHNSTCHL